MAKHALTAVLFLGLGFGVLAALPTRADEPATDAAKIAKLVEQLGSTSFDEREKATKDLDALGVPALEALRKAAKSDDAEVSRRSAELLKVIEKRAESADALKPTKVHLVFKDTPVAEAIEEFNKKSGYAIMLRDPDGKLKDRKVTLDTGDTTFWKAFDQFCEKAGVHEVNVNELLGQPLLPPNAGFPGGPRIKLQPLPPPQIQIDPPVPAEKPPVEKPAKPDKPDNLGQEVAECGPAAADERPVIQNPVVPPQGAAVVRPVRQPVNPQSFGQIMVVDGKAEVLATDYAGAVRVRVLAKTEAFGPAGADEILVGLEITPEPKITWQALVGVKVEKALDDKDQKLGEAAVPVQPGGGVRGPNGAFIRRPPGWNGGFGFSLGQTTVIRLKKGEKASKALKELTGSISAEILPEAKTLISTDEIMKSAGKTFKGSEGGSINVLSVDKDENGQVKVVFELEQPAGFIAPNGGSFPGAGGGGFPAGIQPLPPQVQPLPLPPVIKDQPGQGFAQGVQVQIQVQPAVAQPVQVIQIQVGGGVGVAPGRPLFSGVNGMKLVDDKGKAVEGQDFQMQLRGLPANANPAWVLTFPMKKDQAEAGKLTYSASKPVAVEIPFTLKDIVLP